MGMSLEAVQVSRRHLRPKQDKLCSSQSVLSCGIHCDSGSSKRQLETWGWLGESMGNSQSTNLVPLPQRQPDGMRVVILEPNAENRGLLQRGLDELPGFHLVGESVTWDECISLLDIHLPELLITRTTSAAPNSAEFVSETVFPVVVGLRTKDCREALDCAFETVDIPLDPGSLRAAMERARTEIYRRKLDELSELLQRYMNFSRGIQRYLTSVRIEDRRTPEIPAEHVMFMAADGNYVRVHTQANVYELRETMSGMTAKLDPAQFARVHRSFIVNRTHVRSVLRKDGTAICVLTNGAEIPVGPNYRAEVNSFETLVSCAGNT